MHSINPEYCKSFDQLSRMPALDFINVVFRQFYLNLKKSFKTTVVT